ncbi:MAG: poly(A) polymerase, partial [Solirubrobacterales bacterium]|nr:poly(A) polymerase [Solirubrobacterales bacterium]
DIRLPGQTGIELAARVAERRPGTRVLYMTGYDDDHAAALGLDVADLDLAVPDGEEAKAARAIARAGDAHVFQISDRFNTWRAMARDGSWQADVSALRGGSIDADLAERDFTLNAAAVPLSGGDPIDPFNGLADLERSLLRAVSETSFSDDPLRLMRAARLGAALGLTVESETVGLARAAATTAADPAGERIFAELRHLVTGHDPMRGLELMDELAVTPVVLPELEGLRGVAQNPNHHLDVHGHTLTVLEETLGIERDLERIAGDRAAGVQALLDEPLADEITRGGALRFAAILHDIGKPATRGERGGYITFIGHDSVGAEMIAAMMMRLKTSRALSSHLQAITEHHLRLGFLVSQRPLSRRAIYDYLSATEPVSADVTLLTVADRLSARGSGPLASPEMIEAHLDLAREMLAEALDWRASPPEPPIKGQELAEALGIEAGPEVGRLLEELRAGAFAGEISDREQAIERARELGS